MRNTARRIASAGRGEAIVVGALIIALYLATNLADAVLVGAFVDDGVYTVVGKSIADGLGYHSLHTLGAPVQVRFPPGYPLILAVLWRIGHTVDAVQRMVVPIQSLVIGATVAVLWWIGRQRLRAPRPLLALLVVLPFALDAAITYYTIPLSEPWFMLGWATVLALWFAAAERAVREPRQPLVGICVAIGLATAATILIRTQGIVLLPAIGAGLVLVPFTRRERFAVAAGSLLPLGAWLAYKQMLIARGPVPTQADDGTYLSWFASAGEQLLPAMLRVVGANARNYAGDFGAYLSGATSVGIAAAALLCGGCVLAAAFAIRRAPVAALSALGAIALVAVWPSSQDRLLLSVLPFLGFAATVTLAPTASRLGARGRRATGAVLAIAFALVLVRQLDVRREATGVLEGRPRTFVTPLRVLLANSAFIANVSKWVRTGTSESDRIMIDGGPGIYLYSGRATTLLSPTISMLPTAAEPAARRIATRILNERIDFVVNGSTPEFAQAVLQLNTQCPGTLSEHASSLPAPLVVLKVRRDSTCLARQQ